MLTVEQETVRADDHQPFPTGTDEGTWMVVWCRFCRFNAGDTLCPLLTVALSGRTPAPWQPTNPHGLADRYTCTEWAPS